MDHHKQKKCENVTKGIFNEKMKEWYRSMNKLTEDVEGIS